LDRHDRRVLTALLFPAQLDLGIVELAGRLAERTSNAQRRGRTDQGALAIPGQRLGNHLTTRQLSRLNVGAGDRASSR